MGNQQNNLTNMLQQFQQFKNNFQGDPRHQIQELLNSGKMSQDQFNQLYQLASQMKQFMR